MRIFKMFEDMGTRPEKETLYIECDQHLNVETVTTVTLIMHKTK